MDGPWHENMFTVCAILFFNNDSNRLCFFFHLFIYLQENEKIAVGTSGGIIKRLCIYMPVFSMIYRKCSTGDFSVYPVLKSC